LANRPIQEVETFQKEIDLCFHAWKSGDSVQTSITQAERDAVDEKKRSDELRRIQNTLDLLIDYLKQRNAQVLPNQTVTLERFLKEHKEWSRSVNQIIERLEYFLSVQEATKAEQTSGGPSCSALLAVARELASVGQATSRRLAEVDAILVRVDNLQRELAVAERRVVEAAARVHSPRQTLSGSKASLRSDASEIELVSVENAHAELKEVSMVLYDLRKALEQVPHQLAALSTQGIAQRTALTNFHLPPPNTALLEKSIASVNSRWANVINQIESTNQQLVETCQHYKTVISLRRSLGIWLENTSDLVASVEKNLKRRTSKNLSVTTLRSIESALSEIVDNEERLKELNHTYALLIKGLEDSASQSDAYKRAVSSLPFSSMETATARFVGPPGIGIIDLASLEASVAKVNNQFKGLRDRIEDLKVLAKYL
uniref:Microtubule-actin cross-linking factor 1 n=1 Tax=Mesocestoides corti TaxID=53468 RepID=A0A5K3FHR9_MESCO